LHELDTVQGRLDHFARHIREEPSSLSHIGIFFYNRFLESGDPVDIETAIAFKQCAVDLVPEGHADMHGWLSNLGGSFLRRFERLGDVTDVGNAIRVQRQAVDLTPEGHANKPTYLSNLGISFM
ncbi:hypothetical protein OF83DRAFT_1030541, partial [Amylostereum chailletii]